MPTERIDAPPNLIPSTPWKRDGKPAVAPERKAPKTTPAQAAKKAKARAKKLKKAKARKAKRGKPARRR